MAEGGEAIDAIDKATEKLTLEDRGDSREGIEPPKNEYLKSEELAKEYFAFIDSAGEAAKRYKGQITLYIANSPWTNINPLHKVYKRVDGKPFKRIYYLFPSFHSGNLARDVAKNTDEDGEEFKKKKEELKEYMSQYGPKIKHEFWLSGGPKPFHTKWIGYVTDGVPNVKAEVLMTSAVLIDAHFSEGSEGRQHVNYITKKSMDSEEFHDRFVRAMMSHNSFSHYYLSVKDAKFEKVSWGEFSEEFGNCNGEEIYKKIIQFIEKHCDSKRPVVVWVISPFVADRNQETEKSDSPTPEETLGSTDTSTPNVTPSTTEAAGPNNSSTPSTSSAKQSKSLTAKKQEMKEKTCSILHRLLGNTKENRDNDIVQLNVLYKNTTSKLERPKGKGVKYYQQNEDQPSHCKLVACDIEGQKDVHVFDTSANASLMNMGNKDNIEWFSIETMPRSEWDNLKTELGITGNAKVDEGTVAAMTDDELTELFDFYNERSKKGNIVDRSSAGSSKHKGANKTLCESPDIGSVSKHSTQVDQGRGDGNPETSNKIGESRALPNSSTPPILPLSEPF